MNELIRDLILEMSEAEMREALGDGRFEQLVEEGRAAVEAALGSP